MRFVTIALASVLVAIPAAAVRAIDDSEVERLVAREIAPIVSDGIGGVAVAVRIGGRTLFINHGFADAGRPVTPDVLFNLASLRKVLEATLLAQAVRRRELSFDDPVGKYVGELRHGTYMRRATLGQLAAHTSGLLLPTDHPPWPERRFSLADFIGMVNDWRPDRGQVPGKQHTNTHAGYVLLQIALERRFGVPIGELIERRLLKPLGMSSTVLPEPAGERPPMPRAVQGYSTEGQPLGVPGDQQGFYEFSGAGQMYSSARDLAILLTANLGENPGDAPLGPDLRAAMRLAQRGVIRVSAPITQALAWEVINHRGVTIVDKPGGTNNASAYIGLVPAKRLGIVILTNRGRQHFHEAARNVILPALARR
jgi:beta-lactamase class C